MSGPLRSARPDQEPGSFTQVRRSLLMSIQPRFANAILEGTKTVELRRKPPRDQPDVVIIYGSGAAKAVLGVAQLKEVHTSTPDEIWRKFGAAAGVTRAEFYSYFEGSETASALELANPRRSCDSVPLSRLREFGLEPPQSWRYVERDIAAQLLDALGLTWAEGRVRRQRSLSWGVTLPLALADLGLVEARSQLNRPPLGLVDAIRCIGLGGVGGRVATVRGRRRSAPRPDLS